jgi:hypothetical protein
MLHYSTYWNAWVVEKDSHNIYKVFPDKLDAEE